MSRARFPSDLVRIDEGRASARVWDPAGTVTEGLPEAWGRPSVEISAGSQTRAERRTIRHLLAILRWRFRLQNSLAVVRTCDHHQLIRRARIRAAAPSDLNPQRGSDRSSTKPTGTANPAVYNN